jgi:hypothetical protein
LFDDKSTREARAQIALSSARNRVTRLRIDLEAAERKLEDMESSPFDPFGDEGELRAAAYLHFCGSQGLVPSHYDANQRLYGLHQNTLKKGLSEALSRRLVRQDPDGALTLTPDGERILGEFTEEFDNRDLRIKLPWARPQNDE